MSKIGLQMYTLRNYMKDEAQLDETLRRVAKIGYRNVQISVPPFTTAASVRTLLDKHGLRADSVFAQSMTIPANIDAIAENARAFDTDFVRLDSIPADMQTESGYREYAKILESSGMLLAQRGLKLFYHFHAFEFARFGNDKRGIDILLSDTTAENVGFQPDVFWLTSAGTEPSTSLLMFQGRARYMHVKDYMMKPRDGILESVPRAFAPVGHGNLNWPGILRAAKEIGIEKFVVEQDECDGDPFEQIAVSFQALKAMGIDA